MSQFAVDRLLRNQWLTMLMDPKRPQKGVYIGRHDGVDGARTGISLD
jgi:hypothetical protein